MPTLNSQLSVDRDGRHPYLHALTFLSEPSTNMGKQYNKIEKKRRRLNYLERRKAKTIAAGKGGVKKAVKRPAKKKAPAAAAA